MADYERVGAGSLRLKGSIGDLRRYKKKEKKKRERHLHESGVVEGDDPLAPSSIPAPQGEAELLEGTGRIVATGETVQGFNTKFRHELEAGDTLVLLHPATLLPEETVVASVNTDRTLLISPPFSKDFISTTTFQIKKTAAAARQRAAAAAARKRKAAGGGDDDPEASAATDADQDPAAAAAAAAAAALRKKLKKGSRVVSVREKKGMWGYTVKQVKLKGEASAEEKLDLSINQSWLGSSSSSCCCCYSCCCSSSNTRVSSSSSLCEGVCVVE
ncbi:hypothetical protein Emed_002436 [Eimeria media]